MSRSVRGAATFTSALAGTLALGALITIPSTARAVEGGVSYWVPGFFGSLAASPVAPGLTVANLYYHASVSAGGDVAFARQVSAGNITTNFTGNLNANIKADVDLYMLAPSYTFAERFAGNGQATFALLIPYGRARASVDATLTGNLGLGGPGFAISGGRTDEIVGIGDIAPMFNVRWNNGVHNVMTYVTGNLTVGRYDPTRLANLGLGHNAMDAGAAYTYLNSQTGTEFSATLGFTYNFLNSYTQYQGGVDMHFDWGASRFVTKQLQLGLVGYAYQQLSCDSGAGNRVGCFEGRVLGVGPQIGYVIPMGQVQGYLNLKGYYEFDAAHRPSGWNTWLTFAISPTAETPKPTSSRPRFTK
jgi:hypothetical protein